MSQGIFVNIIMLMISSTESICLFQLYIYSYTWSYIWSYNWSLIHLYEQELSKRELPSMHMAEFPIIHRYYNIIGNMKNNYYKR